jgi:hypothetical protein
MLLAAGPPPLRVRFLTREGTRGRSGRFLRRFAMRATSPRGALGSYQPAGGMTYTRASSGPNVSEKPWSSEATPGAAAEHGGRAAGDAVDVIFASRSSSSC